MQLSSEMMSNVYGAHGDTIDPRKRDVRGAKSGNAVLKSPARRKSPMGSPTANKSNPRTPVKTRRKLKVSTLGQDEQNAKHGTMTTPTKTRKGVWQQQTGDNGSPKLSCPSTQASRVRGGNRRAPKHSTAMARGGSLRDLRIKSDDSPLFIERGCREEEGNQSSMDKSCPNLMMSLNASWGDLTHDSSPGRPPPGRGNLRPTLSASSWGDLSLLEMAAVVDALERATGVQKDSDVTPADSTHKPRRGRRPKHYNESLTNTETTSETSSTVSMEKEG